jgi:excisionase family DNA binding protein
MTQDATQFYTVREVAKILNLGLSTTYKVIAEGHIIAVRIGGSVRVPPTEIDRLRRGETAA